MAVNGQREQPQIVQDKSKMYLLEKDNIAQVLEKLHIEVEKSDDEVRILNEGKQAVCEACQTKITVDNLGHIEKGSKLFYCDNPVCFSHFVAKRRLW